MAISDAVGLDRRSTIIGYKLLKGDFPSTGPNLPQRILVIGVGNSDKAGMGANTINQFTTSQQVGDFYGYGSPMHSVMNILKPQGSDGVGGIPVLFISQPETGLTATVKEITVTGTVTTAGNVNFKIGGREFLGNGNYGFSVAVGDTPAIIMARIRDAVNGILACPYTATWSTGDASVKLTAKYKGLNSNVPVEIYDNGVTGSTFALAITTPGAGAPVVTGDLMAIGDQWVTMVVNTYSPESTSVLEQLQSFNGKPGAIPTGRYSGIIWRPFVAFTGFCTTSEITAVETFASTYFNEVTNSFAPSPGSYGMCYEAAANAALMEAVIAQNAPHNDVINTPMSNMPNPSTMTRPIAQTTYDTRDQWCRNGVSTSVWNGSEYIVKDLITTYHPTDEVEPTFRWVRDIYVDFNMKYAYYLMVEQFMIGKIIVPDSSVTPSRAGSDSISPKVWKSIVIDFIDDCVSRGFIADREFSIASLQVEIDGTNPNRFNTRFDYKRTGIVRISSTNVAAGHFFGN